MSFGHHGIGSTLREAQGNYPRRGDMRTYQSSAVRRSQALLWPWLGLLLTCGCGEVLNGNGTPGQDGAGGQAVPAAGFDASTGDVMEGNPDVPTSDSPVPSGGSDASSPSGRDDARAAESGSHQDAPASDTPIAGGGSDGPSPSAADDADTAEAGRALNGLAPTLELLAGSMGGLGEADGIGSAARFNAPLGVVFDGAGNLFVADSNNHVIRKIVIATGEVSTFAGSDGQRGTDDGIGSAARFYQPKGLAVDPAGNLYVAEYGNNSIRKIVIATAEVSTFAGSGAHAATTWIYPSTVL